MTRLNLSLPDDLGDWAAARAARGGYGDPADYVGELVRREREYEEKLARLQAAIDDGRRLGVSECDPFEYLANLRDGLRPG